MEKETVFTTKESNRLLSLDAFRGATIAAMILVNNPGSWSHIYPPLRHAEWHGWTFTDLIFPFFLFIVGAAIVYAFSKYTQNDLPKGKLYIKIVRRTLILIGLGLFLNGFPYFDISSIRIPGVLQRIGICYFFASLIFLHFSKRGQWIWIITLLFGYWALMEWYPVPGVGAGHYEKGANFSNYIDSLILQGHMWSVTKTWDPEGLVSTIPAIATTLFGVMTGHLLRSQRSQLEKVVWMLIAGNTALFMGTVWNNWLPVNKSIWTSSYSVLMAGLALIVLAFSYFIIDIKKYKKGAFPARVYGMNAITVFVLSGLIAKLLYLIRWNSTDGQVVTLKSSIYNNLFASWLGPLNGSLAFAITFIVVMYGIVYWMYKKKIFIKI
ncbi:MAG: DUF5009 domain-containing protein [Caldithrix sp.]|nr:DUF5009 domain-containing protein [Caldithrix sp.]